ncbi:MAG: hypothetical protein VB855_09615, partial [Pirellulaceae bacterium]
MSQSGQQSSYETFSRPQQRAPAPHSVRDPPEEQFALASCMQSPNTQIPGRSALPAQSLLQLQAAPIAVATCLIKNVYVLCRFCADFVQIFQKSAHLCRFQLASCESKKHNVYIKNKNPASSQLLHITRRGAPSSRKSRIFTNFRLEKSVANPKYQPLFNPLVPLSFKKFPHFFKNSLKRLKLQVKTLNSSR